MNHDCHGDLFTRWGKRWGRCLLDGSIFEFKDGTEFCPKCERPWLGMKKRDDFDPEKDETVLIEIDIPQLRYMAEQKDKKITYLEGQLELWKSMYFKEAGIPRV